MEDNNNIYPLYHSFQIKKDSPEDWNRATSDIMNNHFSLHNLANKERLCGGLPSEAKSVCGYDNQSYDRKKYLTYQENLEP